MAPRRHEFNIRVSSSDLFKRSKELASYIVNKEFGRTQKWDKTGEKLYELCTEMKYKHEPLFDSISSRLNLNRDNIDESSKAVMEDVFVDGCNFGRIVSLYTFCLTLCQFSCNNELSDRIDIIVRNTAEVMYSQKEWFDKQGDWDGFVNYFTTPEDKIWKGFVITTVGLGAVAGFLYANS